MNKLIIMIFGIVFLSGCSSIAISQAPILNQTGNFTFVNQTTVEGGANLWTNSSPDIYYNTGNVGIGTNNPIKTLHVDGDIEIDTSSNVFLNIDGAGSVSYIDIDNTNTGTTGFRFLDIGSARWIFGSDGSDSDKFKISGSSSFSSSNILTLDRANLNVGIGTNSPTSSLKLDVEGKTGSQEYCDNDGNDCFNSSNVNSPLWTGWYDYVDSQYNESSPLTISSGTIVTLPNNALGLFSRGQLPFDIEEFYNGTHILGKINDSYIITLDFKAKSTSGSNTNFDIWFNISNNIEPLYERSYTFPKGNNIERPITMTTNVYTLDTWKNNGATVEIESNGGNIQIYDIRYIISRVHKARNE